LGQTGLGKRVKRTELPTRVIRPDEEKLFEEEQKLLQHNIQYTTINGRKRKITAEKVEDKCDLPDWRMYAKISAGFGHSVAISGKSLFCFVEFFR